MRLWNFVIIQKKLCLKLLQYLIASCIKIFPHNIHEMEKFNLLKKISVQTVDFEEQSMPDMISGNTDAHHCSEKFRVINSQHWCAFQSNDFFSFIVLFHMGEAEKYIPKLWYSLLCYITVVHEFKEILWSTFTFNLCTIVFFNISLLWNKCSREKSGRSEIWIYFSAIRKYCTSTRGFLVGFLCPAISYSPGLEWKRKNETFSFLGNQWCSCISNYL